MTEMVVQTVLGPIAPSELGRTLTHEHLAMDYSHFYSSPPPHLADRFTAGFSLDRVGYLRQYPYSSKFNLLLNDDSAKTAVYNDVKEYKRCGGGAIVENSTVGLKRDVAFLKKTSEETGVHIIAGAGFYLEDLQEKDTLTYSEEMMYDHMLKEMTEGCQFNNDVKAGFMGEVASVWPIRDFEKRAIRAAGQVQHQLNCGVSFHPHREVEAPFEVMRLYLEAGGRADKAVMSHLERTLYDNDKLLEFSELGTYCQFDLFGTEVSLYQLNLSAYMPSDAQRLDKIDLLIKEGKADRVLMSHDVHTKHRLIDFGGHGYSHIINNVLPRMRARGVPDDVIDLITVENPARWLAFKV